MTIQPRVRGLLKLKNDIKLNGVLLEEVMDYKYLGLKIDNKLSFKVHINTIIKNVAGKISNLNRIKRCLTQKAMIDVYKAMIVPLFDVGDVFYDSTNQASLNKLQVLQNRAVRIIMKMPSRSNTTEAHHKLNILSLEESFILHNWHNGLQGWISIQIIGTYTLDHRLVEDEIWD